LANEILSFASNLATGYTDKSQIGKISGIFVQTTDETQALSSRIGLSIRGAISANGLVM
jgi:hypothetical protein